ncbi:hypothetical protein Mapa_000014 [Marchantia paleacea]|nr:hypothetical protein Mapa_000014 [Marchantia paleacea]
MLGTVHVVGQETLDVKQISWYIVGGRILSDKHFTQVRECGRNIQLESFLFFLE